MVIWGLILVGGGGGMEGRGWVLGVMKFSWAGGGVLTPLHTMDRFFAFAERATLYIQH